ncbi:MAG: hypothetical protein KF819_27135, partial [Labilithrix sp.]|nr:hypothetical protein [Labilithrix sp.]
MTDPKTDQLLKDFLRYEEDDRRKGHTLANVFLEIRNLDRSARGMNGRIAALEADREEVLTWSRARSSLGARRTRPTACCLGRSATRGRDGSASALSGTSTSQVSLRFADA